jgi:hypothetical protein
VLLYFLGLSGKLRRSGGFGASGLPKGRLCDDLPMKTSRFSGSVIIPELAVESRGLMTLKVDGQLSVDLKST